MWIIVITVCVFTVVLSSGLPQQGGKGEGNIQGPWLLVPSCCQTVWRKAEFKERGKILNLGVKNSFCKHSTT